MICRKPLLDGMAPASHVDKLKNVARGIHTCGANGLDRRALPTALDAFGFPIALANSAYVVTFPESV